MRPASSPAAMPASEPCRTRRSVGERAQTRGAPSGSLSDVARMGEETDRESLVPRLASLSASPGSSSHRGLQGLEWPCLRQRRRPCAEIQPSLAARPAWTKCATSTSLRSERADQCLDHGVRRLSVAVTQTPGFRVRTMGRLHTPTLCSDGGNEASLHLWRSGWIGSIAVFIALQPQLHPNDRVTKHQFHRKRWLSAVYPGGRDNRQRKAQASNTRG